MSHSRIPSPARSQGAPVTPRHYKPRRTRSVGSPARSTTSGRLSAIIQFKENNKDSFAVSPAPSRRSVLNDDTYIEEPRRRSWWKKLGDNSRDVMDVLNDNKILESNEAVEEYIDIEVLSQEKKNYTMDIPDSSDNESINSIVIPQRKLFTQKDLQTQNKFQKLIGNRETLAKLHKSNIADNSVNVAPKNLFSHNNRPRNKPVFPAALLNVSPNKTANKTKEMATEVKGQVRNLFGNRGGTKRKNMFADFIVSESEDEISDIQPKVFGFQKKVEQRRDSRGKREHSPTSSITTDIEMDEWQHLPSSTMVDNQLEDILAAGTPVKRAKRSKLAEIKESQIAEGENEKESEEEQELKYDDDDVKNDNNSEKQHKIIVQNGNPDEIEQIENDQMQHENNHLINNKSHKNNIEIMTEELAQKEKKNKSNVQDISKGKNRTLNQSKSLNASSNKTSNLSHNKTTADEVDNQNKTQQKTQNNSKRKTYNISQSEIHNTSKIKSIAEIQDEQPDTIQNKTESEERSIVDTMEKSITDSNEKQTMDKPKNYVDDFVFDKNLSAKESDIMKEKEQRNSNNQIDSKNPNKNINCEQATDKQEESQHENGVEQSQVRSDVNMQEENDEEEEQEESEQIEQDESEQEEENDNEDEEQSEIKEDNQETHIASEAEIEHENEMEVRDGYIDKEQSKLESEKHDPENDEEGMDVNDENDEVVKSTSERGDKYVRNEQEENENNEEQANIEEQIYDEEHSYIEEEDDRQDDNDVAHIESEGEVENVSEVENESDIEDEHENDDEMEVQENTQLHANVKENEEECDVSNIEAEESEPESLEKNDDENQEDDEVERDASNVEAEVSEQETHEESQVVDQDSEEEAQNESEELQYETEEEPSETEDAQDESPGDVQNESENEIQDSNDDNNVQLSEAELPNISHDTTGRNRKKNETKLNSPEAILHDKTNQIDSFMAQGRNTSIRKTTMLKNLNIRPSLAPPRESTGMSDGSRNSSVEGSGWDSHRITKKTLRQTFGKEFTPRKSLRALVMEKSAKRQTAVNDLTSVTTKFPQANSTELPESSMVPEYEEIEEVSNHEVSKRTRQTTLEMYLQKIKNQNLEKKMKMEEAVRNSLKVRDPVRDSFNLFKVPSKPMFALKKSTIKPVQSKPKKQVKSMIPLDDLPQEVIEDMKYKPPKRFQPSNASWITKRLYKFLESKLESKYDYKARVRAEKLVETLYHFAKDLRRHDVAPSNSVDMLKQEMARLDVVKTHFEFYQFFNDYMPREIRVKVVPDVVNKISMPRHGVFSDILRGNTVQG